MTNPTNPAPNPAPKPAPKPAPGSASSAAPPSSSAVDRGSYKPRTKTRLPEPNPPRHPRVKPAPKQAKHESFENQPTVPFDYEATPGLRAALERDGMSLAHVQRPTGIRGRFANGVRFAAAMYGPDGDHPATTKGQIRFRLLMTPGGTKDTARVRKVADFYGFTLPGKECRDGAPIGESVLDDEDLFREAHRNAKTTSDIARNLGLSPEGSVNTRIRIMCHKLGLEDLTQPVGPIRAS